MEGTRTKPARIVGGASLDTPERARAYTAAAQRDLNVHLQRLGSPTVLAVDGTWDRETDVAFRVGAIGDGGADQAERPRVADGVDAEDPADALERELRIGVPLLSLIHI